MTLRGRCAGLVAALLHRPSYQDRLRMLIERHAPGTSFVDVGCMWNVDGAYAFHAVDKGAVQVTGIDLQAASERFHAENARRGSRVTFVQGDINDPTLPERLGRTDVVFCSGVLYHVPNPLTTLEQLRALCRRTLILGSATIPEQGIPQLAVYYPFLDARFHGKLVPRTDHARVGLDTAFRHDSYYANWFWGLTLSCLRAMLETVGFETLEVYTWRRAVCVVCAPREARA
jgi:2-polyprenyl-3-methyl-5-hydroxy-6-metoxy-1,4-benzoquinol methylase